MEKVPEEPEWFCPGCVEPKHVKEAKHKGSSTKRKAEDGEAKGELALLGVRMVGLRVAADLIRDVGGKKQK